MVSESDNKYKKLLKSLNSDDLVKWYGKYLESSVVKELYSYFLDNLEGNKDKVLKRLSRFVRKSIKNRYEVNVLSDDEVIVWDLVSNSEAGWFDNEESAYNNVEESIKSDLKRVGLL